MSTNTMQSKGTSYDLITVSIIRDDETSYDIRNLVHVLEIYESIYEFNMTGTLYINDAVGLIESLPMVGNEMLQVEFSVDDGDFTWKHEFEIISIEDVENKSDRLNTMILQLASPQAMINASSKISKFYTGTSSEHVENIATNILNIDSEKLFIDPTENNKDIVVPNMRPYQYIDYLAQNSIEPNSNNTGASFLFFENRDGFSFRPINSLVNDKLENIRFVFPSSLSNRVVDYPFVVLNYHFPKIFNIAQNLENGMYSSRNYTHNIITKEYKITDYQYVNQFDNQNLMADNPTPLANKVFDPRAVDSFRPLNTDEHPSYTNQFVTSPRQSRTAQMDNNVMVVSCKGEPYTTVGNVVHFDIPSTINSDTAIVNQNISGWFMIVEKKHSLTQLDYYTNLNVVKDSYNRS